MRRGVIAALIIHGTVTDHFGIVAQEIGKVIIHSLRNDNLTASDRFLIGTTNDFRLREVSFPAFK